MTNSSSNNNKRFKESEQQQQQQQQEKENPTKFASIPDSVSISLFVSLADSFSTDLFSKSPTSKSPIKRSFDDGAVGLGIVAAMMDSAAAKPAAPIRTEPGPMFSAKATVAKLDLGRPINWKEEEESESYTCVISHVGGKSVRKRVYLDGGSNATSGIGAGQYEEREEPVVLFFNSPPPPPPVRPTPPLSPSDFLSFCYLCNKNLDGIDIFMYRGEKPFCSPECRCQHILSEEHLEKCGSEALKPFDFAVSPCSVPFQSAGIATA